MKQGQWYEIRNAAAAEAEILIYQSIGAYGISAIAFLNELKRITAKRINLRIHSPGGSVFDGSAIYNALKNHPATVIAHIDGLCASMATVVALAASEVRMASNAMFMIHNPFGSAEGGSEDMKRIASVLENIKAFILDVYAGKTSRDRAELSRLMDESTWMNAQRAKALGFVDTITGEVKAAASITGEFDLSMFANAPGRGSANADESAEVAEARALFSQYTAMQGRERAEFFAANEERLRAAADIIDTADSAKPNAPAAEVQKAQDLWNHYRSLPPREAGAFLAQNEAALTAAAQLIS